MNKKILKRAKYLYMPALFIIIGIPIFIFAGGLEDNILFAEVQYALSIESGNVSFDYTKIPPKTSGEIDFKNFDFPKIGTQYGQLKCDKINLNVPIYYGDDEKSLSRGAGQYVQSGIFGQQKDIIIGGHDVTFFAPLKNVKEGYIFEADTRYGRFQYVVTDIKVLQANSEAAYDLSSKKERLILYTCYPFGSILGERPNRYFVYCDKLSGPILKGDINEKSHR